MRQAGQTRGRPEADRRQTGGRPEAELGYKIGQEMGHEMR
jgi:hypothetical protein